MDHKTNEVHKSLTIKQNIHKAFDIWTNYIHLWWPKNHRLSKDPTSKVILEARANGRFYERTNDHAEFEYGTVELCEPPHHLIMSWYMGSHQDLPSKVDIRFTELSKGLTKLDIIHTGPEHLGEMWWQLVAKFEASWTQILAAFENALPGL